MPLPSRTELLKMDTSFRGAPFVRVEAKSGLNTSELDWSWRGAPFYATAAAETRGVSAEKRNFNLTGQSITFKRSVYLINAEKAELEIDLNRFVISGDFTRTFLWDINYGSSVKTSRRINSYGKDNYSLRAQDGINRKKRVWNVSCSQSPETVKEIAHFFRENKGIKSFYWTPPNGSPGRWECTSHNITYDDFGTNTISAEFTEVFL